MQDSHSWAAILTLTDDTRPEAEKIHFLLIRYKNGSQGLLESHF
jgi:hypothetical protein